MVRMSRWSSFRRRRERSSWNTTIVPGWHLCTAGSSVIGCCCCYVCYYWRLCTTSVSTFICCIKAVNWASVVITGCEEVGSTIGGGGRSFRRKDCLEEPVELFWALVFAIIRFFHSILPSASICYGQSPVAFVAGEEDLQNKVLTDRNCVRWGSFDA